MRSPQHAESPHSYARRDGILVRFLRWVAGLFAGGLLILTAVVAVVSHFAPERGLAGPGSGSVAWHVTGAIIACTAQVAADRSRGMRALLWSVIVITLVSTVLFTQWWS
ncbi:hypothetical protein ONR57_17640 [Hoyosella sp. YIM 151337]|uniref:hypothetical protein n=1 Tax=Hoyosella sp. YIM 151337 TaxID=2992742 RepID=UPI002235A9E7|nr:hypothetical protein [Hoyosella sp. YIM 151337]MCW4355132.1 hypothetical protein [Hoyosella sp. YIM 151337]